MQSQDRIPDKALAKMGVKMDVLQQERDLVDQIHELEEDVEKNYVQIRELTKELIKIQRLQPEIGTRLA